MKIVKKVLIVLVAIFASLIILYLIGPKIDQPNFAKDLPEIPADISTIERWVDSREGKQRNIKTDNEAQVVWFDKKFTPTEYVVVYLHGFGASQQEGYPVHRNLADSLRANLFLARQKGHGLGTESAFKSLTAESYMLSAMEALAIGQKLGDKVILVGTSTGASQAIWLAAQFPELVESLVLYSPYIALKDELNEQLVLGPWGQTLTKWMMGGDVNHEERADSVAAYWSEDYHVDAYFSLFSMIHASMTPAVFEKVTCPVFMAYYYKDEEHQDDVVSVKAMKEMFDQLPTKNKKEIAFPKAGNHVIASDLRSMDWIGVRDSSWVFLKSNL